MSGVAAGRHSYFVQLAGAGAADAAPGPPADRSAARPLPTLAAARSRARPAAALASARSADAKAATIPFTVTNAVPGTGLVLSPAGLAEVAADPNVVKVWRLARKEATNANVAQLVKALNTWQYAGDTGKGVPVGVIDTGIDYTHADFGGPGTVGAYEAAARRRGRHWRAGSARSARPRSSAATTSSATTTTPTRAPPTTSRCRTPTPTRWTATTTAPTSPAPPPATASTPTAAPSPATTARSTATKLHDMTIGPGMAPQASSTRCGSSAARARPTSSSTRSTGRSTPTVTATSPTTSTSSTCRSAPTTAPVDDPENAGHRQAGRDGVLVGHLGRQHRRPHRHRRLAGQRGVARRGQHGRRLQLRDGLKVNGPADVAGIARPGLGRLRLGAKARPVRRSPVVVATSPAPTPTAATRSPPRTPRGRRQGRLAGVGRQRRHPSLRLGRPVRQRARRRRHRRDLHLRPRRRSPPASPATQDIPVFQLTKAGTDKLRRPPTAGTLNVTFDGALRRRSRTSRRRSPTRCPTSPRADPRLARRGQARRRRRRRHGRLGRCRHRQRSSPSPAPRWPPRPPPASRRWSRPPTRPGRR